MRVYRIHIDAPLAAGAELKLPERAAGHVIKVLRHRTGDRLTLFDGHGIEADAEIISAHRRHGCRVRVLEARQVSRESPLQIELIQGLGRGDRMDWVIQKAVELGVSRISPVVTEHCEVRPGPATSRRMARWTEILIGACEQAGRAHLPDIHAPTTLEQLAPACAVRLALDPGAEAGLDRDGRVETGVSVAVGPEGGFSNADLAALDGAGFIGVRFGPRVLRTETAGIAAVCALQVLYGDLGGR